MLQQQLEVVLVLRLQLVGLGVHPPHRTEQMQRLVNQVTSEITQQPAPGRGWRRIWGPSLKGRLEPTNLAQLTSIEQPAHGKQVESHRRFWYAVTSTPARSARSTVRRAASAFNANGLSQTTGIPRWTTSSVTAVCVAAGVHTAMASTPDSTRSATESNTGTPGQASATSARRAGDRVTTPANTQPGTPAISGA